MQVSEISALHAQVLWAALLASLVFGAIAQKTHFCTMGAVSDVVNMGDWSRMRQWALAVGVAMAGFAVLVGTGQIDASKVVYASNRILWLSALVGGLMFGFGMVLASGCGSKTLVRIGGGSLKSLVVFLALGVSAFATLKGITAVLRTATVDRIVIDMASGAALPAWIAASTGLAPKSVALTIGLLIGGGLVIWSLAGRDFIRFDNLLAGAGVGTVVVAMWWVSGQLGYVAEHPETLQEVFLGSSSGRTEALSFVAPIAYVLDWLMFFSDKSKLLTIAIVSVVGVIGGSAVVAVVQGQFRWEGFGGTEDVANHLIGGVLMGIGGVTAMGCTVGQGLSGLSTLSLTSFVAVGAIVGGAVLALRYQMWRLDRTT